MKRVIAYIDGFNLYYGLRESKWKHFYWLNLQSLIEKYLGTDQTLRSTKYFTSIVNSPIDKHGRQNTYLEALKTLKDFKIFYGHFLADEVECLSCGHKHITHHEKMTDVNIAVEMITDAYGDHFDTALLVSADSDLVAPIKRIRAIFPNKRIIILFPPGRSSKQLMQVANGYLSISRSNLAKSQFAERVQKPDGYELIRPKSWQ